MRYIIIKRYSTHICRIPPIKLVYCIHMGSRSPFYITIIMLAVAWTPIYGCTVGTFSRIPQCNAACGKTGTVTVTRTVVPHTYDDKECPPSIRTIACSGPPCNAENRDPPYSCDNGVDDTIPPNGIIDGSEPECRPDCTGVPGGSTSVDACGVCGGSNDSCTFCRGRAFSVMDACGVCDGSNSTCTDCDGVINGTARRNICGVCNSPNSVCAPPIRACGGPCGAGVCNVTSNTCICDAGVIGHRCTACARVVGRVSVTDDGPITVCVFLEAGVDHGHNHDRRVYDETIGSPSRPDALSCVPGRAVTCNNRIPTRLGYGWIDAYGFARDCSCKLVSTPRCGKYGVPFRGRCICRNGFHGRSCDHPPLPSAVRCPICVGPNEECVLNGPIGVIPVCACTSGYIRKNMDDTCKMQCPTRTTSPCSGHGFCGGGGGGGGGDGRCTCNKDWVGASCAVRRIPRHYRPPVYATNRVDNGTATFATTTTEIHLPSLTASDGTLIKHERERERERERADADWIKTTSIAFSLFVIATTIVFVVVVAIRLHRSSRMYSALHERASTTAQI